MDGARMEPADVHPPRADVPAPGRWRCIHVTDLGTAEGDCDRCGRERIRFVHHLEHPDYPNLLSVGCVCAEVLLADDVTPRARERELNSRAARLARLRKRKWKAARDGSRTLAVREGSLVVFRVTAGDDRGRWTFTRDGELSDVTFDAEPAARDSALRSLLRSS